EGQAMRRSSRETGSTVTRIVLRSGRSVERIGAIAVGAGCPFEETQLHQHVDGENSEGQVNQPQPHARNRHDDPIANVHPVNTDANGLDEVQYYRDSQEDEKVL